MPGPGSQHSLGQAASTIAAGSATLSSTATSDSVPVSSSGATSTDHSIPPDHDSELSEVRLFPVYLTWNWKKMKSLIQKHRTRDFESSVGDIDRSDNPSKGKHPRKTG